MKYIEVLFTAFFSTWAILEVLNVAVNCVNAIRDGWKEGNR